MTDPTPASSRDPYPHRSSYGDAHTVHSPQAAPLARHPPSPRALTVEISSFPDTRRPVSISACPSPISGGILLTLNSRTWMVPVEMGEQICSIHSVGNGVPEPQLGDAAIGSVSCCHFSNLDRGRPTRHVHEHNRVTHSRGARARRAVVSLR